MEPVDQEDLARAKRVGSLRGMTGLSRRAFSERYGVAPGTLQHWENAVPGISLQGAKRLIKVLATGGVHCSLEWLMHGTGSSPQLSTMPGEDNLGSHDTNTSSREADLIRLELELFFSHYKDAIELTVIDEGMEPYYQVDDLVAGVRYYQQDIMQCLGQNCIVFTKAGELLLRELRASTIPGYYNLFCRNLNAAVAKPILYEVEIVSAAPVLWHRRCLIT